MAGVALQRCRVHFDANVLARLPKGSAGMVAAAIASRRRVWCDLP
jgi:putative transposase